MAVPWVLCMVLSTSESAEQQATDHPSIVTKVSVKTVYAAPPGAHYTAATQTAVAANTAAKTAAKPAAFPAVSRCSFALARSRAPRTPTRLAMGNAVISTENDNNARKVTAQSPTE